MNFKIGDIVKLIYNDTKERPIIDIILIQRIRDKTHIDGILLWTNGNLKTGEGYINFYMYDKIAPSSLNEVMIYEL